MSGMATLIAPSVKATVTVQFQNGNSTQAQSLILKDDTNTIQRHFASVVINLGGGVLTSIVGDNFCESDCVCYLGECYESITSTGYGTIDPVIYVSWAGDDASGKSLLSSSRRLSRFSMYSVSGVYGAVRGSSA